MLIVQQWICFSRSMMNGKGTGSICLVTLLLFLMIWQCSCMMRYQILTSHATFQVCRNNCWKEFSSSEDNRLFQNRPFWADEVKNKSFRSKCYHDRAPAIAGCALSQQASKASCSAVERSCFHLAGS